MVCLDFFQKISYRARTFFDKKQHRKVVFIEEFETYREARQRELFYKSGVGRT